MMKIRRSKKDKLSAVRVSMTGGKYTTNDILLRLSDEREVNVWVSKKLLDKTDYWIAEFTKYEEIEFILPSGDDITDVLEKNKSLIERTVNVKKRRGPALLPSEEFRAKRITLFVTDAELVRLESFATQEKMSIPSLLREKGLGHKLALKPQILDLKAYNDLAHASANLNQIVRHLNSNPVLIADIDAIKTSLNTFRQSLISTRIEDGDEE